MACLEKARSYSLVTPEWVFKRARKKVKSGDYDFDIDQRALESQDVPREITAAE
jgi:hypothetical protein